MASWMIGVDIGGTKISAALLSLNGKFELQETWPTHAETGSEGVFQQLVAIIRYLLSQAGTETSAIKIIGIACAGLIDARSGIILTSPNLPWTSFPLRQRVEVEIGIPVFVMNDANAAALGEHVYGVGKGMNDLIYITVSTGIGGGLILGGRLYAGFQGLGGEVGHMTIEPGGPLCTCGNRGCWEALSSGWAMAREARYGLAQGIPSPLGEIGKTITAEDVYKAAMEGDGLAQSVIQRAAHYLGVGLANLVNLFNPQLIIIGGGVAKMGQLLLSPAEAEMKQRAFAPSVASVRLCPASLGARAGLYGLLAQYRKGSGEVALGQGQG